MKSILENKRAIVTGGASGIAEQTVRLFLAEGAIPVIADVDAENRLALTCTDHGFNGYAAAKDGLLN